MTSFHDFCLKISPRLEQTCDKVGSFVYGNIVKDKIEIKRFVSGRYLGETEKDEFVSLSLKVKEKILVIRDYTYDLLTEEERNKLREKIDVLLEEIQAKKLHQDNIEQIRNYINS